MSKHPNKQRVKTQVAAPKPKDISILQRVAKSVWVRGGAIVTAGGVLLGYVPVVEMWKNTTPVITLRTDSRGNLEPFTVQNNSSLFSMTNYTPECLLDFSMVRIGNSTLTMMYKYGKDSPLTRASIDPGDADNFVCDEHSQWKDATTHLWGRPPVPEELVELSLKIRIRYDIKIGPFTIHRDYSSPRFCGIRTVGGFRWTAGNTTTSEDDASRPYDKEAMKAGYPRKCYTPDELSKFAKLAWTTSRTPKNGDVHLDIPVTVRGPGSNVSAEKMASLDCVYTRLKSNHHVKRVNVFLANRDGFRHAIEYTFRGNKGRLLTGDMLITGPVNGGSTWGILKLHGESTAEGFEELNFLKEAVPDLDSNCHITPAGDYFTPGPKPRSDWQQLNVGNHPKSMR